MSLKLRPLADRVVVKPVERDEMTKSGIVLPDTAKEKPQEGIIEAVGNGRYNEQTGVRVALDVKVGDRVMYAKYAGSEVKIDDVEYLILGEKDILAVVEKNGKRVGSEWQQSSFASRRPHARRSHAARRSSPTPSR